MTETITSTHNPRIKDLRALRARRDRDRSGLFMAEGEDMLSEALRLGSPPEVVFHDADALDPAEPPLDALPESVEVVPVSADALASAGSLGSGSRVIGVWRQRWSEPAGFANSPRDAAAVYLHDVADPGNVGAVVRSAFAFGATGVLLSPRTADPFGPKAVRAAMGAVFGVPVARTGWDEALGALGEQWRTIGLAPGAGRTLAEAAAGGGPALFALGAERSGLPAEIASACGEQAHVPLAPGGAESLNVAMTATLCLYEATIHRLSPDHG
jgi:RNA methyltransferase, TrmH family